HLPLACRWSRTQGRRSARKPAFPSLCGLGSGRSSHEIQSPRLRGRWPVGQRGMFKSAGFLKAMLMALALAGFIYEAAAQDAAVRPVEITTSPISHFRLGSDETRFGALEFVGGLELRSPDPEFGQLSALRFFD